jgi:hypothetical protein
LAGVRLHKHAVAHEQLRVTLHRRAVCTVHAAAVRGHSAPGSICRPAAEGYRRGSHFVGEDVPRSFTMVGGRLRVRGAAGELAHGQSRLRALRLSRCAHARIRPNACLRSVVAFCACCRHGCACAARQYAQSSGYTRARTSPDTSDSATLLRRIMLKMRSALLS